MGLPPDGRKPFFAFSTAVIVIDSLLGGAAVALALGTGLDLSLGPAAGVGGAAAVVSVVGWIRYADRRLDASAGDTQPMFPSPSPSDSDALRSWKSDGRSVSRVRTRPSSRCLRLIPLRGGVVMQILFNVLTGTKDATRASIPLHLAVNGSLEVGDQPVVLLAGDGTEYLVGDAIDHAEGVGLPALRDLVAKLREHEVPVYV
jgi:hypothetical protein